MDVNLPFLDKFNALFGFIVAFLALILGDHWFLFVAFLVFNVLDYITGYMKAYILGKTNSNKGLKGIFKKMGYWFMIIIAFMFSKILVVIGEDIGIKLEIMNGIGYFVLASLIINEITSILENLVEAGYKIPKILTKGLALAGKALDKIEDEIIKDDDKKSE